MNRDGGEKCEPHALWEGLLVHWNHLRPTGGHCSQHFALLSKFWDIWIAYISLFMHIIYICIYAHVHIYSMWYAWYICVYILRLWLSQLWGWNVAHLQGQYLSSRPKAESCCTTQTVWKPPSRRSSSWLGKSQPFVLFRSCSDWVTPTHIRESDLLDSVCLFKC